MPVAECAEQLSRAIYLGWPEVVIDKLWLNHLKVCFLPLVPWLESRMAAKDHIAKKKAI